MGTTKCLTLVKGRRIRLTRLDECGRVVFGETSQAVSSGFISVALTANTSDSDEISVQNANGDVCVFVPAKTSFTGYSAEITFCNVDPELFALATGQSAYYDADGNAIGFKVSTSKSIQAQVGLEVWAGAQGGDACDDPDAQGEFGYVLLPYLEGGIVGDFTIENGAASFVITGAKTVDGTRWGVGPYPVLLEGGVAAVLPTALEKEDHLLAIATQLAPPDAACGTRPLLDPAAVALTSISGATTTGSLTATFTAIPSGIAAAVWYDFGDGTWDYLDVSAHGNTTHLYAAAGTYHVKASSNGVWKTTTVVVPGA